MLVCFNFKAPATFSRDLSSNRRVQDEHKPSTSWSAFEQLAVNRFLLFILFRPVSSRDGKFIITISIQQWENNQPSLNNDDVPEKLDVYVLVGHYFTKGKLGNWFFFPENFFHKRRNNLRWEWRKEMSCHSSFSLVICFVRLPYYNSCGQQSVIVFFSVLHWNFSFSLSFPVILVLIHSEGPSDEMCIKAKMYSNVHVRSPLLRERDELEGDAPVRAALCCCTV